MDTFCSPFNELKARALKSDVNIGKATLSESCFFRGEGKGLDLIDGFSNIKKKKRLDPFFMGKKNHFKYQYMKQVK